MKKYKSLTYVLILLVCFNGVHLNGQGCSDAGICSAGGMLPGAMGKNKSSMTLNMQYGLGEQNVQILTPQLEGMFRINKRNSVQIKLPYVIAKGNIGSNNGLGDMILILNRVLYDSGHRKLNLNGGFRIGVNNAAKVTSTPGLTNNISLPMPYQNSLGTHDLLLGLDFQYKEKWVLALGAQLPFYQFNSNNFDTSKISPTDANARQYFSSDHLLRRPDIILRGDRIFKLNNRILLSGGVLAIYHTLHDRALNSKGEEVAIHGSQGFTINIPISTTIKLGESFSATLRYASPILVRKARPDGLTRHYVIGLELKYFFNTGHHPRHTSQP